MTTTAPCAHHWILASPSGTPTSAAYCKKCGAEKQFANSLDDFGHPWKDTSTVAFDRRRAS